MHAQMQRTSWKNDRGKDCDNGQICFALQFALLFAREPKICFARKSEFGTTLVSSTAAITSDP